MSNIGELAALGTALCWGFNAMMFTNAGKHVGSDTVTHVRLWLALALLSLIHFAAQGTFFPWHAESYRFLWLGLSGAVGFVLGDLFLFEAFVLIGTARSLVVKTFAPALAGVLGFVFLGERIGLLQVIAMVITITGILLVVNARQRAAVSDQQNDDGGVQKNVLAKGAFYAFLGAIGQAVGVVFSKQALGDNFSPISATLIRVAVAAVLMFVVALFQGRVTHHVRSLANSKGMRGIIGGTILGPVIGVSLSLFALQRTSVGVASTLMEMAPVVVLLVSAIVFKERIGWREWAGTAVALAGAAALFL